MLCPRVYPQLTHTVPRIHKQRYRPLTWECKRRFPKGDRGLRPFPLPFGHLRRGEIPCLRERVAMSERQAGRSRPFGATQHRCWKEQLGGASEEARSYWQGRFAACAFVGCLFELSARKTVVALPQTPQGTLSLDPARGNFPLDPFRAIELVSLP